MKYVACSSAQASIRTKNTHRRKRRAIGSEVLLPESRSSTHSKRNIGPDEQWRYAPSFSRAPGIIRLFPRKGFIGKSVLRGQDSHQFMYFYVSQYCHIIFSFHRHLPPPMSAPVKRDVGNPQDGLAKKRRKGATRLRYASLQTE